MKPSTFSISAFFQRERRYIVPLFQRSYVWERQWAPLWKDIKTLGNLLLVNNGEDRAKIRTHFMGAVVLSKIDTFGHQIVADEIIDGQQRLTTIQIFLIALRDYITSIDDSAKLLQVIGRVTENSFFEEDAELYKVWPTANDRKVYDDIYRCSSPVKLAQKYPLIRKKFTSNKYYPRHKLVEAYLFFSKKLQKFATCTFDEAETENENEEFLVEENRVGTPIERCKALLDALTLYFEIVVIELEEKDDPQVIFETLNYLGEPLNPSDLIRNFVFLQAMRRGEKVEELYNKYWMKYFNPSTGANEFWNAEVRQGRLKRPRFDLFIFHYLLEQCDKEILVSFLYQEFREWWDLKQRKVEDELIKLEKHSTFFEKCLAPGNNSRFDIFARRVMALDTSTLYPLLLFLFVEKEAELEGDKDKIIIALESYLIRRLVCNLTTKNYNRLFLSLLKQIKKEPKLSYDVVYKLLANLDGDSQRWPTDDEFKIAWLNNPTYQMFGPSRTRIVLEALDMQLKTKKQEKLHIDEQLSIEHVMPQNLGASGWQPSSWQSLDEMSRLKAIGQRSRIIHTFGNLTLLTTPLNSSMKDYAFTLKRPEITKNSSLQLNAYFQDFKDQDEWTESRIQERGQCLLNIALSIWPR